MAPVDYNKAVQKANDALLAEWDRRDLARREELASEHPQVRQLVYQRDMEKRRVMNEGTPGDPNWTGAANG